MKLNTDCVIITYGIMEAVQLLLLCRICRYENECECQLLLKEMLERLNKVS